jgi:quinol monooxygenase YgiN
MAAPFIFIGTHALKPGKFEEFKKSFLDLVKTVEVNEPRLIAFNAFVNEEGTEVSVVQVHPDADSMLSHMQVVREHISEAYADSLDATTSIQVYGPPSDAVLEMMKQLSTPEVPLRVKAQHLAGFTRSAAD